MTLLLKTQERPIASSKPIPAEEAHSAIFRGHAPDYLCVEGALSFVDYKTLTRLPVGLTVSSLDLSGCIHLQELPEGLRVRRLNLSGCTGLRSLPAGLACNELILRDTQIRQLPSDLKVGYRLDLSNSE